MHIKILDEIFKDVKKLKEFLIKQEIIEEFMECEKCKTTATFKIQIVNGIERLVYRCAVKGCQKRRAVLRTNLKLPEFVFLIYLLLSNASYKQIKWWYGYGEATIARVKQNLRVAYHKYLEEHPVYLGGLKIKVEADETVLSRRGVITCLTSLEDDVRDTVWILGVIEETTDKHFFLKKNR